MLDVPEARIPERTFTNDLSMNGSIRSKYLGRSMSAAPLQGESIQISDGVVNYLGLYPANVQR